MSRSVEKRLKAQGAAPQTLDDIIAQASHRTVAGGRLTDEQVKLGHYDHDPTQCTRCKLESYAARERAFREKLERIIDKMRGSLFEELREELIALFGP